MVGLDEGESLRVGKEEDGCVRGASLRIGEDGKEEEEEDGCCPHFSSCLIFLCHFLLPL